MAITADRLNFELRADLAGLSRDLTGASGLLAAYQKRTASTARMSADVQVQEAKRSAQASADAVGRYGPKADLRSGGGTAKGAGFAVADYRALIPDSYSSTPKATAGPRIQVANLAAGIATNVLSSFLYDGLKGDGTSEADRSYDQVLERLGRTREEAAKNIQSLANEDVKLEKNALENAIDVQKKDLADIRKKFSDVLAISVEIKRNAVAAGPRDNDEKSIKEYNKDKRFIQNFDDFKSSNQPIAQFVERTSLLDQMAPEGRLRVGELSFSERRASGRIEVLNELSDLAAAKLEEGHRAAENMGDVLGKAAADARTLAAAILQPLGDATEDATTLIGGPVQSSSSIGGLLTPVDLDDAEMAAGSGVARRRRSSTARETLHPDELGEPPVTTPLIELYRSAWAGFYGGAATSGAGTKKEDEEAVARQKEIAAAIVGVGDVLTAGVKSAKDFNDALDSIGLGLLDLTAKGLFGQGAFGGVLNQILGVDPGGFGLLSLFGGTKTGGEAASGGSILGGAASLLGSLFGFGSFFGRAEGGQVLPGRLYEVGEAGREWFAPSIPGQVIPNHVIKAAAGGGGASNQPITFNISMAGANGDRTIAEIAAAAVKKGLASVPEINRQHRIRFA